MKLIMADFLSEIKECFGTEAVHDYLSDEEQDIYRRGTNAKFNAKERKPCRL